jgi:hypothetical protein
VVGSTNLTGWDFDGPNKGSNYGSGSNDTVAGGGTGVAGTADSFRYDWTTLTGNGEIIAKVASTSGGSSSSQAGVMIRSANAVNSPEVSLLFSNNNTASMVDRTTTGGATSTVKTVSDGGVTWVKLMRVGNTFSAYTLSGSSWILVSSVQISMAANAYVGLAVSSKSMSSLYTANFSNVTLSGTPN